MSREIICEACHSKAGDNLHAEDKASGWHKRSVKLIAKKPEDHAITINGKKQPQMETLRCDHCGEPIPDGTKAVAITMWRGSPIGNWEQEFGEVVT